MTSLGEAPDFTVPSRSWQSATTSAAEARRESLVSLQSWTERSSFPQARLASSCAPASPLMTTGAIVTIEGTLLAFGGADGASKQLALLGSQISQDERLALEIGSGIDGPFVWLVIGRVPARLRQILRGYGFWPPSSNKCTFDSTMHSAGSDAATMRRSSRK